MLARRALAAAPDRGLQRDSVDDDIAADRHVVDRQAGVLAQQVVGLFRHRDVANHHAQYRARRRVGLPSDQRVEAALDVRRQHLERADVEFLGGVFDATGIDAERHDFLKISH